MGAPDAADGLREEEASTEGPKGADASASVLALLRWGAGSVAGGGGLFVPAGPGPSPPWGPGSSVGQLERVHLLPGCGPKHLLHWWDLPFLHFPCAFSVPHLPCP